MDVGVFDPLPIFRDGLIADLERKGHTARPLHAAGDAQVLNAAVVTVDDTVDTVTVSQLVTENEQLVVVALLESEDPDSHRKALEDGARATAFRDSPSSLVEAALQAAHSEMSSVPTAIVRAAPAAFVAQEPPELQAEQVRWLRALVEGQSVRRLASRERRSERDMHRVLKRLYVRLGAERRADAIARAAKWGLLD